MREEKSRSSQPHDTMQRVHNSRERMQRDEINTMQRGLTSRDRMMQREPSPRRDTMQRGFRKDDVVVESVSEWPPKKVESRSEKLKVFFQFDYSFCSENLYCHNIMVG